MAAVDLERMFDAWATAWSSNDSAKDPERVLALFVDDCVFEDVTFGVVARGKEEICSFAIRASAAVPDFKYGVTRRFATKQWAVMEVRVLRTADFARSRKQTLKIDIS